MNVARFEIEIDFGYLVKGIATLGGKRVITYNIFFLHYIYFFNLKYNKIKIRIAIMYKCSYR